MSILDIIRYSIREGNMNSQFKNEKFVNFPCLSLVEQPSPRAFPCSSKKSSAPLPHFRPLNRVIQ